MPVFPADTAVDMEATTVGATAAVRFMADTMAKGTAGVSIPPVITESGMGGDGIHTGTAPILLPILG